MRLQQLLLLVPLSMLLMGVDTCSDDASDMGSSDDSPAFGSSGGSGADALPASMSSMAGDCAPIKRLGCGDLVLGDTSNYNGGATSVINGYPVSVGNYSGPEVAWVYHAEVSGEVTFRLLNAEPTWVNHDLFVLSGAMGRCLADGALARGFNEVVFDARAGDDYFLVIDGYNGDQGRFEAELECENEASQPTDPPSYPTPDTPIAGNSCDSIEGMWETDSLEIIARCKSILEPSIADAGWFSSTEPAMSVPQADLCLARGTWDYNDHPYYVLSGKIFAQGGYSSTERILHQSFWAGVDGPEHGLENNSSIDLRSDKPGALIIEPNGDWITEALFDKYADTLHVRQGFDPMFGGFDLHYQFMARCARF